MIIRNDGLPIIIREGVVSSTPNPLNIVDITVEEEKNGSAQEND